MRQITLHARVGRQQYKGEPDLDGFAWFYEACHLPLVYNGGLTTVEAMRSIEQRFPRLSGLMVGRGLLARPWLAEAYAGDGAMPPDGYARVARLHDQVFTRYAGVLQGVHQLLARMATFWEYLLPDVDRRLKKRVLKARSVEEYTGAVQNLWHSLEKKR